MFGHQNDVIKQDQKTDANVPLPDEALSALTNPPAANPPTDSPAQPASPPAVTTSDESPAPDSPTDEEGTMLDGSSDDNASSSTDTDTSEAPENTEDNQIEDEPVLTLPHTDDLLDIKQEALHDLSPLVDKLDLNPEEKFKTIMMLIQASDDQSLVPQAYELARQIEDEKIKAQALLDVVNEINYFTQKDSKD